MTLRQKQSKFASMVGLLLQQAEDYGYQVTLGDAARIDRQGHKANSCHYVRLAIDINLFVDGKYLSQTNDHRKLGEWWEGIGGCWGGRFNDGNHYSLPHGKYK